MEAQVRLISLHCIECNGVDCRFRDCSMNRIVGRVGWARRFVVPSRFRD